MYTLQTRKQMKATILYDIELDGPQVQAREKASEPGKPFDFQTAQGTLKKIEEQEQKAIQASMDPTSTLNSDLDSLYGIPTVQVSKPDSVLQPISYNSSNGPTVENGIIADFAEASRIQSEAANNISSYVVRPRDSLSRIAAEHGMKLADLVKLNEITDIKKVIKIGDTIKVTGEKREVAQAQIKPVQARSVGSNKLTPQGIEAQMQYKSYQEKLATAQSDIVNAGNFLKGAASSGNVESITHYKAELDKKTELVAKLTPLANEEIKKEQLDAKYTNLSLNAKIHADYAKRFADLQKEQIAASISLQGTKFNKKTEMNEVFAGLNIAKGLVENDNRITELEGYIAKNTDNPAMKATLDSRREIIAQRKMENDKQLALLRGSPTYASITTQNKTTA